MRCLGLDFICHLLKISHKVNVIKTIKVQSYNVPNYATDIVTQTFQLIINLLAAEAVGYCCSTLFSFSVHLEFRVL